MAAKLLRSLSSETLLAGTKTLKTFGAAAGGRPLKRKGSSAKRRQSEFNVFGDGDIVSVDFLLQSLKAAQEDTAKTKLELEDLVRHGSEERDAVVFSAVSTMLKNDGNRPWIYIKFIDDIRIGTLGDGLDELQNYEKDRRVLWDDIQGEAAGKPITFQLKLEIEEDTPVSTIIEVFNEVLTYNLASIEFLGSLYGVKAPEIGDALAQLCTPDTSKEVIVLEEMVMLKLVYVAGDRDKSLASDRDRVWKKVLRRCIRRLGGKTTTEGEPLFLGDSEHSRKSSQSKQKSRVSSPKGGREGNAKDRSGANQGRPDIDLMRAAAIATRVKSQKRLPHKQSMPELSRAASERLAPTSPPSGVTRLPNIKRRKPRSFATLLGSDDIELDDEEDRLEEDFCKNDTNRRINAKWKVGEKTGEINARDDKTLSKLLHPESSLCKLHSSAVHDVTKKGARNSEARSRKEDNTSSKPLPPKRGVARSHTSPMEKRDHFKKAPAALGITRTLSAKSSKTKPRPSESKAEDQGVTPLTKCGTRRSKGQPAYDWDKHPSDDGTDCCCTAKSA